MRLPPACRLFDPIPSRLSLDGSCSHACDSWPPPERTLRSRRRSSGRAFAPWIAGLRRDGYRVHLLFLRLDSGDLAVGRVKARVQMGGHHIPEETVRRRFETGLRNFFRLYLPLADTWQLFDNSSASGPRLIAEGEATLIRTAQDGRTWQALRDKHHD